MVPSNSEEALRQSVRVEQIIIGALGMGLVSFLGVTLVAKGAGRPDAIMPLFAAGFSALMIVVRLIVPPILVAGQRKQIAAGGWIASQQQKAVLPPNPTNADRLLIVHRTKTIVEGALLEGPAFFVLIVYMLTRTQWLLGLVAVLLAIMLISFPTRERVEQWISAQLELLELEKSA